MKLKLRNEWGLVTEDGITYLYPPGRDTSGSEWYVYYLDAPDGKKEVVAYPKGLIRASDSEFLIFSSILKAHELLIKTGNKSPWEEVESPLEEVC